MDTRPYLIVDGVVAAQTPAIETPFREVLPNFSLIIEIGFHRGGLSAWLFRNKLQNTRLVCYDIDFNNKLIDDENIDFREGNCFSDETTNEIVDLINSTTGSVLVLCDGGNKEAEFYHFSKHLKSGDVIMCHDYAHDPADHDALRAKLIWPSGFESYRPNIEGAIQQNNLSEYHYEDFKNAFWGSFVKN